MLLPFQGASLQMLITQGDALGCVLVAPSGRKVHNNCISYFLQFTKRHNVDNLAANLHKISEIKTNGFIFFI